jgi:hypothetical protein
MLDAILTTGDGDEAAIGHLYMLAKTFRQMLVILERNVRDQRMLWAALWQGFRVPPFAADDIIKQARRYKSKTRTDPRHPPCRQDRPRPALESSEQTANSRGNLFWILLPNRNLKLQDGCRKNCRCKTNSRFSV